MDPIPSRRTSARLRSRSTSTLQPRRSHALSQPAVWIVEPSPRVFRNASQPAHSSNRTGGPISINLNITDQANENETCPLCTVQVHADSQGVFCEKCSTWFHPQCLFITEEEYQALMQGFITDTARLKIGDFSPNSVD